WGYSLMCATVVGLSMGPAIWMLVMTYTQLFKPLGLPNSEGWYGVQFAADAKKTAQPATVDVYTYQELLKLNRSADYIGAFETRRAVLSEGQATTALRASAMSPHLLAQVVPLIGRTLQDADGQPGAPAVAILSFNAWQDYF